ncbi:MAG: SDR family oxidoreductase [Sphingomonadaceae bacterium]|nr:SDR family oxidoreductase [Sphingomonadaceae bacterium]
MSDKLHFDDRHILVTGASTGIGRATAALLAERGARVSMIARSEGKLAEAVAAMGGDARWFAADVGDKSALLAAFDEAEAALGPIEGLFANAGTGGTFAPLADYADEDFDAVIRVNLASVFWAIKRVLPGMVARGRGSILVTGSLASERGMANNAAYVASKHGVLGLARAAAIEVAPHGVRVNCVIPGFIETPMLMNIDPDAPDAVRDMLGKGVPQGRIGSAEELAEAAAFLLSDAASHITAQAIAVDGGILGTLMTR